MQRRNPEQKSPSPPTHTHTHTVKSNYTFALCIGLVAAILAWYFRPVFSSVQQFRPSAVTRSFSQVYHRGVSSTATVQQHHRPSVDGKDISRMARTPVYFLSHGGVSADPLLSLLEGLCVKLGWILSI